IGNSLIQQLQKNHPGQLFSLTGDIRRQNETVEFIEIVTDLNRSTLIKEFEAIPGTVIEDEPDELMLIRMPGQPRVRFHLTDTERFFHTLFMTTGSDEFINAFLSRYIIPEAPETEEAIFSHNHLSYIPPMLRETTGILDRKSVV